MEAVSQTGTRAGAPPMMSTQSPGTKLSTGHEAPLSDRPPRPAAPARTLAANVSNHQQPRLFLFHLDVSRSPRAKLSSGSNDFVFLPDPGFQREKMSRCERLLLVGGLIFFQEMPRFPGQYIDESRLAITPS